MVARITQTNNTPFERVAVDSITIDIVENALSNARHEMDAVLFRTAMSPGIREQGDAFPLIATNEGKMIVGQFGSFITGFLESYTGEIEEGDIFLTNDPYLCNGAVSHLPDWLVLMPIFKDGRVINYSAMFGHMSDVGGKVPGSLPTNAASIWEEGIRIPPVKLYRKGVMNSDMLDVILHNVRLPRWNRSDLNAIVAACRTAGKRCVELAERFGDDVFYSAQQEMLDRTRRAMKEVIQRVVPEQRQVFEDYICDDGAGLGPYTLRCALWREGEKAIFDFTGTDPQAPSSVNFYLNEEMFKIFFGALTISLFDPAILLNDGFYDLVEVRIPQGSLLKPNFPAALSCRTHALGRIFDMMSGLLGQGAPDAMNAAGFSDSPHFMYSGYDKNGEWFQLFQIGFGGIPGRPAGDGADGHSLWPGFTNVPNEFVEAYFPLRIESYETLADTGGAGLHRGGNGLRVSYRMLADGEISIHDDRWLTYPWGVSGGEPGERSRKELLRADGTRQMLPSKCDNIRVSAGDLLLFDTWGGGGWGDPFKRDPAKVLTDVRRGLVSVDGARRYGVVIVNDAVDQAATDELRAASIDARGPVPLFDRGGSLEELKAPLPGRNRPARPRHADLELNHVLAIFRAASCRPLRAGAGGPQPGVHRPRPEPAGQRLSAGDRGQPATAGGLPTTRLAGVLHHRGLRQPEPGAGIPREAAGPQRACRGQPAGGDRPAPGPARRRAGRGQALGQRVLRYRPEGHVGCRGCRRGDRDRPDHQRLRARDGGGRAATRPARADSRAGRGRPQRRRTSGQSVRPAAQVRRCATAGALPCVTGVKQAARPWPCWPAARGSGRRSTVRRSSANPPPAGPTPRPGSSTFAPTSPRWRIGATKRRARTWYRPARGCDSWKPKRPATGLIA